MKLSPTQRAILERAAKEDTLQYMLYWKLAFLFLLGPDAGLSATAILCAALGVKDNARRDYPYDPRDLGRCLRLLEKHPWAWAGVEALARKCPVWKRYKDNWSKLRETFICEAGLRWEKADSAPKTYKLMAKIRQDKL